MEESSRRSPRCEAFRTPAADQAGLRRSPRLGGGESEGDVVGELFDGTKIYRKDVPQHVQVPEVYVPWSTIFLFDAGFGSVALVLELAKRCIHFACVVKQAFSDLPRAWITEKMMKAPVPSVKWACPRERGSFSRRRSTTARSWPSATSTIAGSIFLCVHAGRRKGDCGRALQGHLPVHLRARPTTRKEKVNAKGVTYCQYLHSVLRS